MKKYILMLGALILTLGFIWLYQLGRSLNKASEITAMNSLTISYAELRQYGAFTNPSPSRARIFAYTNDYVISGTNYHCILAADSWHYQGAKHVLAISTNGFFLLITEDGPVHLRGTVPFYVVPTNKFSN